MVAIRDAATPRFAPGALALMPALTFAATAQAAQWAGLTPLIADVDPETWSIDPDIEERLLALHGDRIAVLVPYAPFGHETDLDRSIGTASCRERVCQYVSIPGVDVSY